MEIRIIKPETLASRTEPSASWKYKGLSYEALPVNS